MSAETMNCLDSGLNTDLYEITMGAVYWKSGLADKQARFELFVRSLPRDWGFLVACGLQAALEYLEHLHFDDDQIAWLAAQEVFAHVDPDFWDELAGLRFEGDVWALPEGRAVFAGEPLLRVDAPLLQAQIVETALLARINFETLVATKAARLALAASGRPVVDFGTRRAHGPQAGMIAARASYVGGVEGTSNLCAGRQFGIPVVGTTAHSFVLAFENEQEAFEAFASVFPAGSVLVVDTYEPVEGAGRAARLNWPLKGVRLDGGDLQSLSRKIRALLDEMGRKETRVLVSGDLDEDAIAGLVESGAPVDSFGVGTRLVTSWGAPALGGVYKLVDVDGRPVGKRGGAKATRPGVKQVFRVWGEGRILYDILALADEDASELAVRPDGADRGSLRQSVEPMLEPVMRQGMRLSEPEGPTAGRLRWSAERRALPGAVTRLRDPEPYEVRVSGALDALTKAIVGS